MTQAKIVEENTTKLAQVNDSLSKQNFQTPVPAAPAGEPKNRSRVGNAKEPGRRRSGNQRDPREVRKEHDSFRSKHSQTEQTYPNLVENLMKVLRQRNIELQSATEQLEQSKEEIKNVRAQETAAREKAEAKSEELAKDLAKAREEYKDKEDALKDDHCHPNGRENRDRSKVREIRSQVAWRYRHPQSRECESDPLQIRSDRSTN